MKRTFQPSILVKKRSQGFLARTSSPSGRKVLRSRMRKGRKYLIP